MLFLALLIGVLSSLLGIGGGELMGPLMLHLKVLATVSPATTSMMSFLNTSSSIVHYMTLGKAHSPLFFHPFLLPPCRVPLDTPRHNSMYVPSCRLDFLIIHPLTHHHRSLMIQVKCPMDMLPGGLG